MNKQIFAVALGAAIVSTQAGAQPASAAAGLTRQEAQQFADGMFQRLDLNHDGVITRDEADQAVAQFSQGGNGIHAARAQKMLDELFGTTPSVTQTQFDALALARFDKQDANHDGVVTPDERHHGHGREQN